ncbi:cytochrome P450 [Hypomontagnella monticulosa]|nr:cytochrome P450 [Hypomontagnella monticulosa]
MKMASLIDTLSFTPKASLIIPATFIALVVCYIAVSIASWYRLRVFPGPTLAKFSYLWSILGLRTGRIYRILVEEQDKYGKVMRIGPNELLIYDPETIWRMNGVRSQYGRGDWYAGVKMDPYGDTVLSELDTAKHDGRKAFIASGYAGKGNVKLEEKVDHQLAILVELIKKNYARKGNQKVLDFSQLIRYFQVDLITLSGFGESWGDLTSETDRFDLLSTSDFMIPILAITGLIPIFRDLYTSSFFLRLAGPKTTDKKGMGRFLGAVKQAVNKRFDTLDQPKPHGDTLDEWIKRGLPRRECELELSIQIPAGGETTSTAMRGTMLYLLSSPKIYQKLQKEIADGIRDGRISSPISQEEARKLPYLQAVIHEGLRMIPPIIFGFPKRVPPGGDTMFGKFVPAGTDIFVNTLAMVQNKEIFGDDAEIFRPERFLECDEAKKAELFKIVDLVFGHGRWMCPGKTIARLELDKIFVELLRNFDFQIANPQCAWKCRGYSSYIIDDFFVRVTERSEHESL